MKNKSTKHALLASILSIVMCFAMLIGSTFAWFTDEVKSGMNKIVAGNLNVELYHSNGNVSEEKVDEGTKLFIGKDGNDILWEPGAMVYENFTVKNEGTLALKYRLTLNSNFNLVDGKSLKDVLKVAVIEGSFEGDRATAQALTFDKTLADFEQTGVLAAGAADDTYAIVIYWEPSDRDNDYNIAGSELFVEIGASLVATQAASENDSFDNNYDENAELPSDIVSYEVTPDNIQEYLNGEHGSLLNAKLILAPGNYGTLNLSAPSKFVDTVYTCVDGNGHSQTPLTFTDADEFNAHFTAGSWHSTPRYTRTISNLTLVGQEGVTVNGMTITSGHVYGDNVYDPVRDKTVNGSCYYMTLNISNVSFVGIDFVAKVNIATSDLNTFIDGVTFEDCSFTTNGTTSNDGAGLRYYNESNNGNIRDLTVKNCSFENCFQGIYTSNIVGVTVSDCNFSTTGHNAIAIQSGAHGPVNHKAVVIENNTFTGIRDRIIRFGSVDADTQITIKNNTATASGDGDGEVIKAQSLAQGVTYDISNNSWGEGTKVANPEFADK